MHAKYVIIMNVTKDILQAKLYIDTCAQKQIYRGVLCYVQYIYTAHMISHCILNYDDKQNK